MCQFVELAVWGLNLGFYCGCVGFVYGGLMLICCSATGGGWLFWVGWRFVLVVVAWFVWFLGGGLRLLVGG